MNFVLSHPLQKTIKCIIGALTILVTTNTVLHAQQNDSLHYRIAQFDSLPYENKLEVVEKYIKTDLNANPVNLFILNFNEYYHFLNREVYRKSFYNTSFNDSLLKQDSLFFLLKLHIYDDQIDSALHIFEQTTQSNNRRHRAAGRKISDYYFHKQDYEKALYYFNQAFHFNVKEYVETNGASPFYWQSVNRYFELLKYTGNYETILTYADSILQKKTGRVSWLEKKADAQYYLKKYRNSAETYEQILAIDSSFNYVNDLLQVYNQLKDTSAIVSLLRQHSKQSGEKNIESRYLLYDYLDYYEYDEQKDSVLKNVLNKAASFYDSHFTPEAYYYYALFLAFDDRYRAAIKTMKQGRELIEKANNGYPYERVVDSYSYYRVFDFYTFGEARELYKSKYEYTIGWLYQEKGRKRKAIKHFERAINCYEYNVDAHYEMAHYYRRSFWKKDQLAIPHYEKIISCDLYGRNKHPAITSLAHLYVDEGQLNRAKKLIESSLSTEGMSSDDFHVLCRIHYKKEEYEKAIKMIDKAIAIESNKKKITLYKQLKELIIEMENLE